MLSKLMGRGAAQANMTAQPVRVNPSPRSKKSVARQYGRIGRIRLRIAQGGLGKTKKASMEAELMRRVGAMRQAGHEVPEDPHQCLVMAHRLEREA